MKSSDCWPKAIGGGFGKSNGGRALFSACFPVEASSQFFLGGIAKLCAVHSIMGSGMSPAEISFPVGAGLSLSKGRFDNATDARIHEHQARCAPGYPTQTFIGWGGTLEKNGVTGEAETGADEKESADREQEVFGYEIHGEKIVWKSAGSSNILRL